jgi:hypothetical protein
VSAHLELGVPPVQRADTNGEGNVEGRFSSLEHEIFDRNLPHTQPTGGDLVSGRGPSLLDRLGRAVNREDMTVFDPMCDRAGSRAGAAADSASP